MNKRQLHVAKGYYYITDENESVIATTSLPYGDAFLMSQSHLLFETAVEMIRAWSRHFDVMTEAELANFDKAYDIVQTFKNALDA